MTDNWQAAAMVVDGASISLPVGGFSNGTVPHCCPDVNTTLVWHWTGTDYQLVSAVPSHLEFPPQ